MERIGGGGVPMRRGNWEGGAVEGLGSGGADTGFLARCEGEGDAFFFFSRAIGSAVGGCVWDQPNDIAMVAINTAKNASIVLQEEKNEAVIRKKYHTVTSISFAK
jgi:hypothetical protein